MSRPALELSELRVRFGGINAVDGFGMVVRPGEVTGLVGPNGAGKSSVLNLVNGYYPCDQGCVRLRAAGELVDVTTLPVHARSRLGLGRTFQSPRLIPEMSTLENVEIGSAWSGDWRAWGQLLPLPSVRQAGVRRRARALKTLERFGIARRAGILASALSLGEQRIVELARAIQAQASVLLLDEPFAGLADGERRALGEELLALAGRGVAILLVEHNLEMVRWLASTVTVMEQGRELLTGPPAEALADERVQELYLGSRLVEA